MARKPESPAPVRRNLNHVLRYATTTAIMLVCAVGAIAAYLRTERFLLDDARFLLAAPGEDGEPSPGIRLHGIDHARRDRVLAVFDADYGRSVYRLPLAERRRQLLAVDWVKEASLRRSWPNRLDVHLTERRPVAFVPVPAGQAGATRFALIDEDGFIMEPPPRAEYHLPVLLGARRDRPPAVRREVVRRMLRLLSDAGEAASRISEIDAGNAGNLKVIEQADNRILTLLVGDRDFRARLDRFHSYYPQIRDQLGETATLDLRVDNRIVLVKGAAHAK
jgi:cell division protein FtsQ